MPHKSIRKRLGIYPPDLCRKPWDQDKHHLEREKCRVWRTEQRLLICEPCRHKSKPNRSSTFSVRRLFSSPPPSEFERKRWQHDCGDDGPLERGEKSYKITGKLLPPSKNNSVFDFPEGLLPLRSSHGHQHSYELIWAVRSYLVITGKWQTWRVVGALPSLRRIKEATDQSSTLLEYRSPAKTFFHELSTLDLDPHLQFVLIERQYRCNCEEWWRPKHNLKVKYKQTYTPDTQTSGSRRTKSFTPNDVQSVDPLYFAPKMGGSEM
jgi:hypothetical protein